MNPDIRALITTHLGRPSSAWSVGVRGAIAEFLRAEDEVIQPSELERLEVRTGRGAIRVFPLDEVQQITYQNTRQFCLTRARARFPACHHVVTELGPDSASVCREFADDLLFDLGLGIPHVRACVRTAQPSLLDALRENTGCPLLGHDQELARALTAASPHRVFFSRLARIEVFGPIPTEHTPNGPHTHLLPALVGTTDETLEAMIPPTHASCLSLYAPD